MTGGEGQEKDETIKEGFEQHLTDCILRQPPLNGTLILCRAQILRTIGRISNCRFRGGFCRLAASAGPLELPTASGLVGNFGYSGVGLVPAGRKKAKPPLHPLHLFAYTREHWVSRRAADVGEDDCLLQCDRDRQHGGCPEHGGAGRSDANCDGSRCLSGGFNGGLLCRRKLGGCTGPKLADEGWRWRIRH